MTDYHPQHRHQQQQQFIPPQRSPSSLYHPSHPSHLYGPHHMQQQPPFVRHPPSHFGYSNGRQYPPPPSVPSVHTPLSTWSNPPLGSVTSLTSPMTTLTSQLGDLQLQSPSVTLDSPRALASPLVTMSSPLIQSPLELHSSPLSMSFTPTIGDDTESVFTIPQSPASQPNPSLSSESTVAVRRYEPPLRPDIGHSGRPISLRANHFQVKIPSIELFHYDVAIIPEKCPRRVNREVVEEVVKKYSHYFGGQKPVFDGRKNLYSKRPLPIGRDRVSVFTCKAHRK